MTKVTDEASGKTVNTNVDENSFNMLVNTLAIYSIRLLEQELDGQLVADALKTAAKDIAEEGSDQLVYLVGQRVAGVTEES